MEDSQKDENLKNAFKYIHTFYNEVALLLSDSIEILDKQGWVAQKDSITDELSYSLEKPENWCYYYIYKNFVNKKINSHYKGMLIFFDESRSHFPASIVFGKVNISPTKYHRFRLFYLWTENKELLQNNMYKVNELETIWDDGEKITGSLYVIPLTKINSKESLKENVIKKLLEL